MEMAGNSDGNYNDDGNDNNDESNGMALRQFLQSLVLYVV